jgi:DNA-binding LacI/PurR family transcriptional regulator
MGPRPDFNVRALSHPSRYRKDPMTRTGRGRPTLEQVALRAGVSRATSSRVVSGSPRVAPEIQEAVRRAIAELGYVPNTGARRLPTQRTGLYALVVPEPASRVFSDDLFFPGLIQGVSEELEAADSQLVLTLATSPTSNTRIVQYAIGRHVDGVMIASMHGANPLPAAMHRFGVPVVANGRPMRPAGFPYVDIDHAGGVETAIRYLVRSGRNRIATIAGPQDMVAGVDRLAAFRSALVGSNRRSLVGLGDFTRESGAEAMRRLLADDPGLDAVFVASDLMADGALRTLRQAGRRIPDDVAVIGFDDVETARYTDPGLTTVRQPIHDLGRQLARQVVRLARGEDVESSLVLPTQLMIRGSA